MSVVCFHRSMLSRFLSYFTEIVLSQISHSNLSGNGFGVRRNLFARQRKSKTREGLMRRLFVREAASEKVRDEMRAAVRLLALPLPATGEYVETSIGRVARDLGLDWGEVKALWYRERKVIPTELSDFLREEVELRRSDSEVSEPSVTEQPMQEFQQLRERLDALEAMIKGQNDAQDYKPNSGSGQRVLPRAGERPGRHWRAGTSAPATA